MRAGNQLRPVNVVVSGIDGSDGGAREAATTPPAGTQALPVDTIIGKRRGRPQTIDDMKAYKAQKAKEYRAKQKAKPNA